MSNQIYTIKPYLWNGIWVFDDPAVGLVKEALVAGMPEIIVKATSLLGIKDPGRGFIAMFSKDPFYESQLTLTWRREEAGGNVYEWDNEKMEGWLCPALFQYFDETPPKLYVGLKPIQHSDAWSVDFEDTEIKGQRAGEIVGPNGIHLLVHGPGTSEGVAETITKLLNQHWHEIEDEFKQGE